MSILDSWLRVGVEVWYLLEWAEIRDHFEEEIFEAEVWIGLFELSLVKEYFRVGIR
jgi:hypothetical protein